MNLLNQGYCSRLREAMWTIYRPFCNFLIKRGHCHCNVTTTSCLTAILRRPRCFSQRIIRQFLQVRKPPLLSARKCVRPVQPWMQVYPYPPAPPESQSAQVYLHTISKKSAAQFYDAVISHLSPPHAAPSPDIVLLQSLLDNSLAARPPADP